MERGQGLDHSDNTDWTGNGKNYFLGIGIDSYQHWEPLNNAVKDVNDFIGILTQQYQFEADEVHSLFNADATEGKIYNKIRELKRAIQPQDNLVVYYSGHGHYDEEFNEGYWVPVDAETDCEDRFISNANIIQRINAIDSHHTLLIVDSCFSGTLVVKKRSGLTDERFKSRRILASGRQETVADGQPGQNSPFAAGILTYLKKNTEKAINTTALVQYVKNFVETKARQTPVEGRIQNSADEGGEFVFHLKMDEKGLWESVVKKDHAEAYANYLDYYPQGIYANQADRRILQLKEDDIWHSAKIKDSELAYENYLKKYAPGGKYVQEANDRLARIHLARQQRQEALDQMAQKEEEREQIRQNYNTLIAEAENLFATKELNQARERYREALRYYMPGFVPKTDYVDEQITFCSNGIIFLDHYDNGRRAMDNYNYRLALQYFGEALKVDDNPKVEDLMRYCRLKLDEKEGRAKLEPMETDAPEPPVQETVQVEKTLPRRAYHPPAPVKKKSGFRTALVIGGVFILLVIVALLINGGEAGDSGFYSEEDNARFGVQQEQLNSGTDMVQQPVADDLPTGSANYPALIQGSWQLTDFYSDDPNAEIMLNMMAGMQATYTFYPNGQVNIFSSLANSNFYYYLNSDQLTIPGAIPNADIDQLDQSNLVFTAYFNESGYTYSITFEFRKTG